VPQDAQDAQDAELARMYQGLAEVTCFPSNTIPFSFCSYISHILNVIYARKSFRLFENAQGELEREADRLVQAAKEEARRKSRSLFNKPKTKV
jgi:hypothetical protein